MMRLGNITNPIMPRFTKALGKVEIPKNLGELRLAKTGDEFKFLKAESNPVLLAKKKTFATLAKEFARQAQKGIGKTAKGIFDEGFYKKYIETDEKLLNILKTNSKKDNLKFSIELGKLTLIFGGLVVATALPVPATGTLYAASIPKIRKLASKINLNLMKTKIK